MVLDLVLDWRCIELYFANWDGVCLRGPVSANLLQWQDGDLLSHRRVRSKEALPGIPFFWSLPLSVSVRTGQTELPPNRVGRWLSIFIANICEHPRVPENALFCRIWTWKLSCKQSWDSVVSRTSYGTCTHRHFPMPTVITSALITFDCTWHPHSVKSLLDWILKLIWSYLNTSRI